jgi:hypothetical protein
MPPGRPRKTQRNVLMKSAELIGWAIVELSGDCADTRAAAALTRRRRG